MVSAVYVSGERRYVAERRVSAALQEIVELRDESFKGPGCWHTVSLSPVVIARLRLSFDVCTFVVACAVYARGALR
jgi:hypothetical protein